MSAAQSYRLSRIQAEGWNAAHAGPSSDFGDLDVAAIEALSPYHGDPEKARWVAGFRGAFKTQPAVPG